MRLTEKYRPKKLSEILGQDAIVASLSSLVSRSQNQQIPHLLFVGPSGCGKTTAAYCLAYELFGDAWQSFFIEINASDERGINTIRDKIKVLSSLVGKRIIFLDETDAMTQDAQWALRRIMETTPNTIFILSCNAEYKILDAIKSRCAVYHFKPLSDDIVRTKLISIIRAEGIQVEAASPEEQAELKEGLEYLVKSSKGDLRHAINTLEQLISANKKLTVNEVALLQKSDIVKECVKVALLGNFELAKSMIEKAYYNESLEPEAIVQDMYDSILALDSTEITRNVRIRLYAKLADVESRLKQGSNPLIQLVGFLAFCWLAPHLKDTVIEAKP
jgi:replication factor C small subunit